MLFICNAQSNQAPLSVMSNRGKRLIKLMSKPGGHFTQHAHLPGGFQRPLMLMEYYAITFQLFSASSHQQHDPNIIEREQQERQRHAADHELVLN